MTSQNHRRETRIVTGPEFTISFTLKGYDFQGVRIMNLSVGGCFALVTGRTARFFLPGEVLEGLVLGHPDLPKAPLTAAIAYVLGYSPDGRVEDQAGVGLQFREVDAASRSALEAWVEAATATDAPRG